MTKRSTATGRPEPDQADATTLSPNRLPQILQLKTELLPVSYFVTYGLHARLHNRKQRRQIMASIRHFGFLAPVLITNDGTIISGHARVEAARKLALTEIPAIRIAHLTPEEIRIFRIAENEIAQGAEWDLEVLSVDLKSLEAANLDIPLELTGFDGARLDSILELNADARPDKADLTPTPQARAISRLGDLWLLGGHRVLCDDSLQLSSFEHLMGEERARMVLADGPYNVKIDGNVGGLGKVKHRDFVMGSGEWTPIEFRDFILAYMRNVAAFSLDGAIHFHCMDWRGIATLLTAGAEVYAELKNLIVWVKSNGAMGTFYRSQHELVAVFKVGSAPHINTFGLGETGRYRTNVWQYPGASAFGQARDDLVDHPTPKNVAMIADAIKDVTHQKDIVLDPFGGSGTTLIAAHKARRRARLIELDPIYVDVICRRWEAYSGEPAVLEGDGRTFEEIAAARDTGVSSV